MDIADIENLLKVPRGLPATAVDFLRQICLDVLHQHGGEMRAEEVRKQEPRQIHTLVGIRITVVVLDTTDAHPENFASHVCKETRLLIHLLLRADVREELLGKNIPHHHLRTASTSRPRLHISGQALQSLLLRLDVRRLGNRLVNDAVETAIAFCSENQLNDLPV